MRRRRRRAAEALTLAVVLGAFTAPGAAAHVTVLPATSRPAELQRYRVVVPNERAAGTTTGVDLRLPAGMTFVLVEATAGWQSAVVRHGGEISQLRWRGGRVPPGGYAELHFIARNPVRLGPLAWKALQRYDDGDVVRWIGAKGSEEPAAITTLGEDAVPVDVVSTHGEATPVAATGATEPVQPVAAAGRVGLTLALAILGALLGSAALIVALRRPSMS